MGRRNGGGSRSYLRLPDGSMENDTENESEDGAMGIILVVFGFTAIAIGVSLFAACGRKAAAPTAENTGCREAVRESFLRSNGIRRRTSHIRAHSGHTIVRRQQTYDSNYRGGGGGESFIGGSGGGSFGGGRGFGGGSFRRRNGEGGGAGSRF